MAKEGELDLTEMLYSVKVVAMMEVAPITDDFVQIVLSKEQTKKLLELLESFMPRSSLSSFVVVNNDRFRVKIPNIPEYYTPEQIEKYKKDSLGRSGR